MILSFAAARTGSARRAPEAVRRRGAAWRAAHPPVPVAPDATLTFAIPLMGRDSAADWARVEANLRATLRSLRAQTAPRWRAIVCGQDRPDTPFDAATAFLPYPERLAPGRLSDQQDKIAYMIDHLTAAPGGDGWVFFLDADDLVHPGLVAYVTRYADRAGYVITRGYLMDAATGAMGYHGENKLRYRRCVPFCKYCGSSTIIRMDLRNAEAARAALRDRGGHGAAMHHMAAYGVRLSRLPFAGAIYVVNHGDNMRLKRGKQDRKLSYLAKNRLSERARRRVAAEFGLEALLRDA